MLYILSTLQFFTANNSISFVENHVDLLQSFRSVQYLGSRHFIYARVVCI